jgi:predicted MFS family arabinose efflux permease
VSVDAGTYVASAGFLVLLKWRPPPMGTASLPGRSLGTAVGELVQGLRHVIASRPLRGLLVVMMTFLTANGAFTALLIPYVRLRLHGAAGELGLLLAATGVGFLVGAPFGRALLHRVGLRWTMASSLLVTGISFLGWFNTTRSGLAFSLGVLAGASAIIFLVARRTQLQVLTPDRLLGRTSATFLAGEAAATLGGAALGGCGVGLAGLTAAVDMAGAAVVASALLAAVLLPDRGFDP